MLDFGDLIRTSISILWAGGFYVCWLSTFSRIKTNQQHVAILDLPAKGKILICWQTTTLSSLVSLDPGKALLLSCCVQVSVVLLTNLTLNKLCLSQHAAVHAVGYVLIN